MRHRSKNKGRGERIKRRQRLWQWRNKLQQARLYRRWLEVWLWE